jgi:Ca2+-binding RTX toxin-like protein
LVVTVDTVAPAKPVIASFSPDTAPTGDGHTTATTLTLTGTGEANSTIQAFDGTKLLGTAAVNASGVWNFATGSLAVGAHSFIATDTDAAGNTSVASAPLAVTVDSNIINGTRGNDILTSTIGNDIITTGGGNDLIIFSGANFGNDTITDFRTGNTKNHDTIQFDHTVFANFAAVQGHAGQVGSNTVITLDANDSVTLTGVLLSNLHSFDFQFV